ncbi:hypothetical protein DL240_01080 [Lujinxingia litoralis]|uniref:Peptidase M48 domain-containing protein n=1 Tax=Lujinxingia litoralis TaxID=2211119 RepID=A0A328C8R3_9DELT|nr:M48 family metallopeptidase [Lujinxingia litoralis]RAL24835.1 hypothetical protein DL240_01080 [Lujinxingia litoralis]
MDFFAQQDTAKRNTSYLVGLFALAVVALTAVTYVPLMAVKLYLFSGNAVDANLTLVGGGQYAGAPVALLDWGVVGWSLVMTLVVVGCGSFYKISELNAGGSVVAEELGGEEVDAAAADPLRRRLYNVVEEMALASGLAVPRVYVLPDEQGINAFAAGYTINDAAVAVTQGALETLTRDELQAVIAHEFSHILNGDMRLNVRLIGVVHGILIISIAGRVLVEAALRSGRRTRKDGGATAALLVVGGVMAVGGWLGVMFGRMIKSAVSRQREFLADAAAVQFTRNPVGLAGALKKIAAHQAGSALVSPRAEEVSHMCFGAVSKSFKASLQGIFDSHPPIEARIRRWDPGFHPSDLHELGAALAAVEARQVSLAGAGSAAAGVMMMAAAGEVGVVPAAAGGSAPAAAPGAAMAPRPTGETPRVGGNDWAAGERELSYAIGADEVVAMIGNPGPERLVYCASLLTELPQPVMQARAEVLGATSLVYAMLMDPTPVGRRPQIDFLRQEASPGVEREVQRLWGHVRALEAEFRLPVIDLLLPTLRRMTPGQYEVFKRLVGGLIFADGQVTLFEFVVQKVLMHRLEVALGRPARQGVDFASFNGLAPDIELLLSTLAAIGHEHESEAAAAFRAGVDVLPPQIQGRMRYGWRGPVNYPQLGEVLDRLSRSSLGIKRTMINACSHCVLGDGRVTVEEIELLRALCDVLDLPLPPLVPRATRRMA